MSAREAFDGWAILELMGHRKLAGRVSEATIAGGAFLRIDVPGGCGSSGVSAVWCPVHGDCTCRDREDLNDTGCPLHDPRSTHPALVQATQFYSPGAVYAITPTTEEIATRYALRERPIPVQEWELPSMRRRAIAATAGAPESEDPENEAGEAAENDGHDLERDNADVAARGRS